MKVIAAIPARYESSRFTGKLLAKLGSKTVIRRTYEATKNTGLFHDVFVVCNHTGILDEIISHGGIAILSEKEHNTGSDRIAEAVKNIDFDIAINVQGDEPFTKKEPLKKLIQVFQNDEKKQISVATLAKEITDHKKINDPNCVKVVKDQYDNALYFSRSPIPFTREQNISHSYFEHIGIYAFRKEALLNFYNLPMTPCEKREKLECLRFLEYGISMRVVETKYLSISIDTPQDLAEAQKLINN